MSSEAPATAPAAAVAPNGLQPSAYADAFVRGPPREGVQRIQTRLHKAKVLTDELADYFAARRELESSYLKALSKIAKRSFLSDPSALGPNFSPVYERLVMEIGELASIHGELEKKLESECEVAMRSAPNRGEWGRIKDHDDNLASTLKEINTLELQLSKDQKKAEMASSKKAGQAHQKATETERSLSQTMEVWETESPFAFEAYQRIDSQRLDLMKEIVTKFETAQSDAAQRLMQVTEQTMQVILNFDPQADMQEFALRNATSSSRPPRREAAAATTTTTTTTTTAAAANQSTNTRPPAPSSGPSAIAATLPTGGSDAYRGAGTNGVSEFGAVRASSASIHSYDRPGTATTETQQQTTPSRLGGSTLKSALTRFGRGRSSKNANENATSTYGNLGDQTESSMGPPSSSSTPVRRGTRGGPAGGGGALEEQRSADSSAYSAAGLGAGAAAVGGAATAGSLMAPLTPSRKQSSFTPATTAPPPQVDAEGFSIPPPDRKPWELGAGGAPAAGASLMDGDDDENESRDLSTDAGMPKMTGMSIAPQAISENAEQDQAALERMRSTLLTARSPVVAPQRRNTTRRDRRDVRNTTYNPGLTLPPGVGEEDKAETGATASVAASGGSQFGLPTASSPMSQPSAFIGSPGVGGDRTQSIISMSSASAAPGNLFDGSAPGLRASILERVNVLFTGRQVTKIMVVGEVSVSLRDVAASREPIHIRLESFEQLEKAAPNPAFLQPIDGDRPGEYKLDVGALLDQGNPAAAIKPGSGGQAVLLQYKVHVSESRQAEYVPLDVSTQWRCEAHQTSMLLNFSPNASSRLATSAVQGQDDGGMPASLQDVSLTVDAGPSNVTGVMSKPSGTWSAEQKRMYWRLPEDVALSNGIVGGSSAGAPQKILARWQVDGQGQPQPVQIRWRVPGRTLSSLGLSVVDESASGLRFDAVSRQTVSGKYIANP